MQDFLAGTLLLACLTVAVASMIALIKPIPQIGISTRRRALGGLGIAFALFIATAIAMPSPPEQPAAPKTAVSTKKAESAKAQAVELTEAQESMVSFVRNIVMQSISCGGDMDMTQTAIDKLAAGKSRPIDVYQEAKRGIKSCDSAMVEFDRSDMFDTVAADLKPAAREAMKLCRKPAQSRKKAMQLAQELLEEDGSLASVSRYMELRDTAKSDEIMCRYELIGLAEKAGVPKTEMEFAEP